MLTKLNTKPFNFLAQKVLETTVVVVVVVVFLSAKSTVFLAQMHNADHHDHDHHHEACSYCVISQRRNELRAFKCPRKTTAISYEVLCSV